MLWNPSRFPGNKRLIRNFKEDLLLNDSIFFHKILMQKLFSMSISQHQNNSTLRYSQYNPQLSVSSVRLCTDDVFPVLQFTDGQTGWG